MFSKNKINRRRLYEKLRVFERNLTHTEEFFKERNLDNCKNKLYQLNENFRDIKVIIYLFLYKINFDTESKFQKFFLIQRFDKTIQKSLYKSKNLKLFDKILIYKINKMFLNLDKIKKLKEIKRSIKLLDKFNSLLVSILEKSSKDLK